MRYFTIERKDVYRPRIALPYTINEQINLKKGKTEFVERVAVWTEKESDFTFFSDILTDPLLLLSSKAKEVLQLYDAKTAFKQIILFGKEEETVMRYYLPVLSEVNGQRTGDGKVALYKKDKSILERMPIVRLKIGESIRYLLNMEIVESFLKRRITGINVEMVDIVFDREYEKSGEYMC